MISSIYITIDTGEFNSETHQSIRTPVNIFNVSGDSIVMDEEHVGEILNTIQPAIYEYARKKVFRTRG